MNDARYMTFENAVQIFKNCLISQDISAELFNISASEISVPAFPNKHNKWVCYHMWKTEEWHNEVYYVEFIIHKDADNRWDLVKKATLLIDNNPEHQRFLTHCTYYADNHWQTRCPAWNEMTLKADIELLKTAVAELGTPVNNQQNERLPVGIGYTGILDLLKRKLIIPDYQRAYCWTEKNIRYLLQGLSEWYKKHSQDGKEYHLGTIILKRQHSSEIYDVIDGQQRLITLALIATSINPRFVVDIALGSNNKTKKALDAIRNAQTIIQSWHENLNLSQVCVSVVEIAESESEDLAFNFFNHFNSSGVPLTDYELLKGHHLRYVKDDNVAQIMARRWHALDMSSIDNFKEQLLHKCLYRIRKWLAKEWFAWNADERETHDLFHEFILDFELPKGLCTAYKEVAIDSILSGGLEFFDYVNRYRMLLEQFLQQESIEKIKPLRWHSYGTLYEAIIALSFLFYCKFGEIYLKEAVYAISWNVSSLRAMGQVRRSYLGDKEEFRAAAIAIVRATHECEVIGKLLDKEKLKISDASTGEVGIYWRQLQYCANELEGKGTDILNWHYQHTFVSPKKSKEE